jgi:hypothetical protein
MRPQALEASAASIEDNVFQLSRKTTTREERDRLFMATERWDWADMEACRVAEEAADTSNLHHYFVS